MNSFNLEHIVSFEETNLVGNVYYANYVRWQGKCREMFLKEYSPDVLKRLSEGLYLVTTKVSCEYLSELFAFDRVQIRMYSGGTFHNKVKMKFEYWKMDEASKLTELVCRGEQEIACLQKQDNGSLAPIAVPDTFYKALKKFEVKK
ncbi:acyl-CoA thioesterase [Cytobacillus sp. FSL H8-0458]|uniref:acyl-CoA thioesterase n=1 Tax=Cytobacillus sp. FSL H8-0458 TaxID=2975346 RepID=UPI0030F874F2